MKERDQSGDRNAVKIENAEASLINKPSVFGGDISISAQLGGDANPGQISFLNRMLAMCAPRRYREASEALAHGQRLLGSPGQTSLPQTPSVIDVEPFEGSDRSGLPPSSLIDRGANDFVRRLGRQQDNVEAVAAEALKDIKADARPDDVDDDWLENFFDTARAYSSDEMRTLCAHLLAEEINQPGRISRQSINRMRDLGRQDILVFKNLLSLAFCTSEIMVMYHANNQFCDLGLEFDDIKHLESLGLIFHGGVAEFISSARAGKRILAIVPNQGIILISNKKAEAEVSLKVGKIALTRFGVDLASSLDITAKAGLLDYLRSNVLSQGLLVADRNVAPDWDISTLRKAREVAETHILPPKD